MAVCYLDTQDRQAEQNFDKMTFLDVFYEFKHIFYNLNVTKWKSMKCIMSLKIAIISTKIYKQ